MDIGILSDSHFHANEVLDRSREFSQTFRRLQRAFEGVDHLIHAGDVVCKEFVRELEKIAPVSVVRGNMDDVAGITVWPKVLTIEFEGIKFGVGHRLEYFSRLDDPDIRVFVYGHTHIPSVKENPQGVLLINPGSVTRPKTIEKKFLFRQDANPRPTVAIINVEDGLISSFLKKL